ncbi:unnamed protein product, partial [Adineta steineri]
MLAVSMSEEEVENRLLEDIEHLACIVVVNSPPYPDVFKARLRIENAFHSYQMNRFDIEKEMLSSLKDIREFPIQDKKQIFDPICAKVKLYSSVIGEQMNDNIPVNGQYWWSNVRQAVRFYDAMASIQQHDAPTVFLELSPHPVLATSIRECYE